jgi:hypothetical protein
MATATLTFDQPSYGPGDTIGFTVTVDAPMTSTATVTGTVELPGGTELPAVDTRTVVGIYGPFTCDGYTVTQNPTDPSRFTATPTGG